MEESYETCKLYDCDGLTSPLMRRCENYLLWVVGCALAALAGQALAASGPSVDSAAATKAAVIQASRTPTTSDALGFDETKDGIFGTVDLDLRLLGFDFRRCIPDVS
jgi:hypothetical protein